VDSATRLVLPTTTLHAGNGVVRKRSDTECEDEPQSKQARTLDTTPHYITVKAGSLRYSYTNAYIYTTIYMVITSALQSLHITIVGLSVIVRRRLSTTVRVVTQSPLRMRMKTMTRRMMSLMMWPSMNRRVVKRLRDHHR
jgi:hypothetical protein